MLENTDENKIPSRYKKYVKKEVQYLGCRIKTDYKETTKINIDNAVRKIMNLTEKWMNRRTTLSGKIAIIKSLLIPQLTYILTTMTSPEEKVVKEINKKLFTFLNSGGSEKIKRNTLIGEYEEGGFKMTDLESYIRSIKINWITRLINIEGIWKEYIKNKIGMDLDYFARCNLKYIDLHFKFPKNSMWDEVMREWCDENFTNPETYQEILNQNLWRNSHIKIGNKTNLWKKWYEMDIKWIADLIMIEDNNQSRFLTFNEINDMAEGQLKQMEYNSLISAIPKTWKRKIIREEINQKELEEDANSLLDKLLDSKKPMKKVYMRLKKRKVEKPTNAMNKWRNYLGCDVSEEEILKGHTENHYSTINARMRSHNCNFLNRNIPYNSRLEKMKKIPDSRCSVCKVEETLEHLYWECPTRKRIWDKVKEIYEYYNGSPLIIDKKNCLLGIIASDNTSKRLIAQQRLLFLIVKHYLHINKCREDSIPSTQGIVGYIKKYLKIELLSSERKGTQNIFRERWEGWVEWLEEE
jgi:hypothetical protein